MLRELSAALRGPPQARGAHRQALKRRPDVISGIERLQSSIASTDGADDSDDPIFLLAAGWRSGSTLLQRLVMSDSSVLIWGEPYDECGTIQALAESTKAFRPEWPPREYFYDGGAPKELSGNWIANLFPSLDDLRRAHRAFFDEMFAKPARRGGAARWGLKEVRLGSDHSYYLRWLYPKAKFVFLYRHPLDAYRSYTRYGRSWYDTFPDRPVFTPAAFGAHWHRLMSGFARDAVALGALLLRYEDLVGEHPPLDAIERHLGVSLDPGVLKGKIGGSEKPVDSGEVSRLESWLLKRAVRPVAGELGYRW